MNDELELSLELDTDVPYSPITEVVEEPIKQDELENFQEQETDDEPEEQTAEADALAKATYKKYVELGYINEDHKFDETRPWESIDEALEDLPAKALNQALAELPQESQAILNFIATAGKNVTAQELYEFTKQWVTETQTEFTVEDEARQYLETKLTKQGLRPKAIQAQLDDLEDSSELLEEANKLLKEDQTKTAKLTQAKAEQNQQVQNQQKQFYSSIQEELKQLNYTKKKQDEINSTMPKANQILTDVVKKPKAYVQLMDFLSKFTGDEFNLDSFIKQGETKASNTIKDALSKSAVSSSAIRSKANTVEKILNKYEAFVD